jgi:hypothetical protein
MEPWSLTLGTPKNGVVTSLFEEFLVRARFDDSAAFHQDDTVCADDASKTVRHTHDGTRSCDAP